MLLCLKICPYVTLSKKSNMFQGCEGGHGGPPLRCFPCDSTYFVGTS